MIDTCSNPACNEPLVYLRSGVLYEVVTHSTLDTPQSMHFFWLCNSCSKKYDLHFNEQGKPRVVRLSASRDPHEVDGEHHRVLRIFINQPPPVCSDAVFEDADPVLETPYLKESGTALLTEAELQLQPA
jgi:hypothetical protein